jgi:hypothetical protein
MQTEVVVVRKEIAVQGEVLRSEAVGTETEVTSVSLLDLVRRPTATVRPAPIACGQRWSQWAVGMIVGRWTC